MQGYRINIYDPWVKTDKISEDIKISLKNLKLNIKMKFSRFKII